MKNTRILTSSILLCGLISAVAQTPSAVQQSEQFRLRQEIQAPAMKLEPGESASELYPGENQDLGPQSILQIKPRRTWVDGYVDSQYYWSDNVTLAGSNEQDSTIFVNTIEAAFAPSGLTWRNREIAPRIGVRAQWYNYGLDGSNNGLGIFDFHSETAFAETRYNFAPNWQASLGLEAGRLLDQDNYKEFYREIAPTWGLSWVWPIAEDKALSIGYRGYYHFTETESFFTPSDVNDRTDHNLSISYVQEVCPKVLVQPFYRFQYSYYTGSNSRHDTLHDLGLSISYHFTHWASLRTFAVYELRDSGDESVMPDYDSISGGLGASLVFQF